jgi:hypothetical protein
MYKRIGTPEIVDDMIPILREKYHMHLSKAEVNRILNHGLFSNTHNAFKQQAGIWWRGKFKIYPDEENIMRRLLMKLNKKINHYIKLKEQYYDNSEQKTPGPF